MELPPSMLSSADAMLLGQLYASDYVTPQPDGSATIADNTPDAGVTRAASTPPSVVNTQQIPMSAILIVLAVALLIYILD